MTVRDIMTPNPASCTPEDSAQRAALVMRNLDVGAVPIVDNEMDRRPVGIVTDRDLCSGVVAHGLDPTTARLGDLMTGSPVCCRPEDSVDAVSELMQARQVRRITVVDAAGTLCGIVAMADLARKVPREAGEAIAEVSQPSRAA
jgi:CBS domain-containing protein